MKKSELEKRIIESLVSESEPNKQLIQEKINDKITNGKTINCKVNGCNTESRRNVRLSMSMLSIVLVLAIAIAVPFAFSPNPNGGGGENIIEKPNDSEHYADDSDVEWEFNKSIPQYNFDHGTKIKSFDSYNVATAAVATNIDGYLWFTYYDYADAWTDINMYVSTENKFFMRFIHFESLPKRIVFQGVEVKYSETLDEYGTYLCEILIRDKTNKYNYVINASSITYLGIEHYLNELKLV